MKSPFLLPLYLVAVFLLFLLGFTAVALLWDWMELAPQGLRLAARVALDRGVPTVERCLAAALLPALFFTALRVARIPVARPFSLLLPAATAFCLLYFGPMALRAIPTAPAAAVPAGAAGYLETGVFVPTTGSAEVGVALRAGVVTPVGEAASLGDVVAAWPRTAEPPRLSYYRDAAARVSGGAVEVTAGDRTFRVEARSPYTDMAKPAESTTGLLGDLATLTRELVRPATETSAVLIAAGVVAFFWFSCFLLRLTRWPLLSIVVLGLAWRGALAAMTFLADVVRPGLADLVAGSEVGTALAGESVALVLLLMGGLCLVVDLVFVKFDFWTREIEA